MLTCKVNLKVNFRKRNSKKNFDKTAAETHSKQFLAWEDFKQLVNGVEKLRFI